MADITLNSAVRSNLRTLQSTTDLLNRTEERLSTGKKVNSALDNPASFFTAQALDRRASDLSGLLDSVSTSVKALEAADNGIKAINDVVESLKATARSALQSPSAVQTKANVESGDVANLTETNLIGGTTSAATPATLTGTGGFTAAGATLGGTPAAVTIQATGLNGGVAVSVGTLAAGDDVQDAADKINAALDAATGGDGGVAASVSGGQIVMTSASGEEMTLAGDATTLTGLGFATGNRVSTNGVPAAVTGSLEGQTLTVRNRDGLDRTVTLAATGVNTLDELNKFFEDNDVDLRASVSIDGTNGKLKLETTNAAAFSTPADIAGTITGSGNAFAADQSFSTPVLDADAAEKRANFVADYNEALEQINSLAKDASFNGVNLLNGDDLDIVFNEDGSSKLDVRGVQFDAAGVGLEGILDADFYDANSINAVIDNIDSAFSTLEAQSSKFGSQLQIVQTRESFTKDMVGTLEDGALALTGADTNEEAANLATLQTRQALIVSSLSISTQQESNVLQLLR